MVHPYIVTDCIVCGNEVRTSVDRVYTTHTNPDEFGCIDVTINVDIDECKYCASKGFPLGYCVNLLTGERV
jgi:hypothetical protein